MLIDVHSHYLPKELARALEKRVSPPCIVHDQGNAFVEYSQGSKTPLTPVFSDPDQILERMDGASASAATSSAPTK